MPVRLASGTLMEGGVVATDQDEAPSSAVEEAVMRAAWVSRLILLELPEVGPDVLFRRSCQIRAAVRKTGRSAVE